jgi:predicted CoA-binding protein
MRVSSLDDARALLASGRIAVVGVSRNPKDFSRMVFGELSRRGLDVVPVNPVLVEVDGRRAFARVRDVAPPPDAALLMVPPARAEEAVRDCLAAGVRRIWFHRGAGAGSASAEALAACLEVGVVPVQGLCPFMVLPHAAFLPHGLHGWFRRRHAPREAR